MARAIQLGGAVPVMSSSGPIYAAPGDYAIDYVDPRGAGNLAPVVTHGLLGGILGGIGGLITGGPAGAVAGAIGGHQAEEARKARAAATPPPVNGNVAPPPAPRGFAPLCPDGRPPPCSPVGPAIPFGRPAAPPAAPAGPMVGPMMGMGGYAPATYSQTRRDCGRGGVLGADGLCYSRKAIRNSDRMWPRGRRPLLTGGDLNAISRAARAAKRVKAEQKKLEKLGLLRKPKRGGGGRSSSRQPQLLREGRDFTIIDTD